MGLKTYSISNDIASGTLNPAKLHAEIQTSGAVEAFGGITAEGDAFDVLGQSILDEPALDAVVSAHFAITLDEVKTRKNATIDARTKAIIAGGFAFNGKTFSLSGEAQRNWTGLFVFQAFLTWPVAITTNDDEEFMLDIGSLPAFVLTGVGTVGGAIASGRALKLQVNAAMTPEDVAAVVDNR